MKANALGTKQKRMTAAMLLRFSVLALAALAMSACQRKAEPVGLAIDDHWLLSSAVREACPPPENPEPTCVQRQQVVARDFELTLSGQFAALPACSGLLVATLNALDTDSMTRFEKRLVEAGGKPQYYWNLYVYFVPGARTQAWDLLPPHDPTRPVNPLSGEGQATQIATEVCNIVRGRGGTVATP